MSVDDLLRYEKVEDTLIYFGNGISLQFIVNFAWKQNNNGERRFYYSEYEYRASLKYPETEMGTLVSVKRDLSHCYLCINNKNNGVGIIIRKGTLPSLQNTLEKVSAWVGADMNKVFKKDGNHLRIVAGNEMTFIVGAGMAIKFEPIPLTKNDEEIPGIRMYLNDTKVFIDLTPETINEFLVVISRIDFYAAASAAVSAFNLGQKERIETRKVMESKDTRKVDMFKKNKRRGSNGFFDKKDKEE